MITTTRGWKLPEAHDSLRASVDYLKDTFERISLDEDGQDSYLSGSHYFVMGLLERIALAETEHKKTLKCRNQEGAVTIVNRGVVTGCTVDKSGTNRALNLASGTAFAAGRIYPVAAMNGAATIPDNGGGSALACTVYLAVGSTGLTCAITQGGAVPDGAISLYMVTVPAGNNAINDPTASLVTLTSVRRVEAYWPALVSLPTLIMVPIQDIPNADYQVIVDPVSWVGPRPEAKDFWVQDRLSNGFKIYYAGLADRVVCRYMAVKMGI